MKSPKDRKPLFERLKTGLEEAISRARGEITLKSTTVQLPQAPPDIDAETLVANRTMATTHMPVPRPPHSGSARSYPGTTSHTTKVVSGAGSSWRRHVTNGSGHEVSNSSRTR
jgi:hypothetical protein